MPTHPPADRAGTAGRLLLVSRDDALDSLLARRRVAAHVTEARLVSPPDPGGAAPAPAPGSHAAPAPAGAPDSAPGPGRAGGAEDGPPADAALVCDDPAAAERLVARGVPVVHLRSGHIPAGPGPAPDGRALYRVHRPGWLPAPGPGDDGTRATGTLAPVRTARARRRSGTLLLLSLWDVPEPEAAAFASDSLPALVRAAARRSGSCAVVYDSAGPLVRAALDALGPPPVAAGSPAPPGRAARDAVPGAGPPPRESPAVTVCRAADTDVDALHAGAEVFLAAPTLAGLALAYARRAPVTLLPPLGAAQRDLADRVAARVRLPTATDPDDPAPWRPADGPGHPWDALDPALDDLRGAQRVARTLRQLSFAPL
ncbi:CGA synthase-related protein [Streptomyces sp. LP05-1]|uniref:CGA synthase-related protein n=1 Tax=Streptomyces pyxinae TaxID=2970734 RepID=A0ABT2CBM8_9ACTN|nr:CGA synthase-related protein [Streptomyces sp. LP05-1]MCS0634813.1 CGA synthase-related protein [Streptomyces sp. LP05-1]